FVEDGVQVYCAAFSACKQNVRPEFPDDILIREVKKASGVLGVQESNLFLFEYQVRTFHKFRQEILDDIIRLREKLNPDLVFIPSTGDIHQDHKVISEEGIRAFKHHAILSYELPWNNFSFTTTCFSVLTKSQVQKKADAIAQYKSQAHRNYANPEFAWSLARTRGVQINQDYAECFEIIRLTF
ncbi:MAG: PIG-L family deacetylase, partial [Bacteroidetes bacterium]|nr:PIG-L family deacetylase [Bacteroidota bacterium]